MGCLDIFPTGTKFQRQNLQADAPATRAFTPQDPFQTTKHVPSHRSSAINAPIGGITKIAHYQIVRPIASGTMGRVFRAVDETTLETVALKLVGQNSSRRTNAATRKFFMREVSILSRLDHPRIVSFRDFGEIDGQLYMAMEYVETFNLRRELTACSPAQQIRLVCGIGCYMLAGLAHAHALNIIHRDIKPANLLVYRNQGNKIGIKLADFGTSKDVCDADMTREGEMRGTPAFMSPEQLQNSRDVGPVCDVYSTASVLYYFLTGTVPHQANQNAPVTMSSILEGQPLPIGVRRADLPQRLCRVIDRGLAPLESGRFETAVEFNQALIEFTRKGNG